ncbi:PRA1 family protein B4 [Picochlorum sp. SENEW3]|nr:PRA1 family protein B4 [Picochlorum sp. SENEW3]
MADAKVQNNSGGQQPEHSVALAPHSVDENGDDIVQQQSRFKALTDVFSKLRDNAAHNFKNAKPMSEVFDMTMFSKPSSFNDVLSRLRTNATYFKTNYAVLAVGTTALVMLLNPWSLIVLAVLALVWFYMYVIKTSALVIGGREFSDREKFWLMSGGSLFVIFFLTSVGATIFYSLGLSMVMIAAHASMRIPDDTTLFEEQVPDEASSLTGLLSMFRPKASTVFGDAV